MLILGPDALAERRKAVRPGAPLAGLFDSLAAELEPWLRARPAIATEKAVLSRAGGRCATCGSALDFDPGSPHAHRCPRCGRVHQGDAHDRAWIMPYQLWLAERALHGALFHLLRGDASRAAFAREILAAYGEAYLAFPNRDNVLGPSRLFFSTYLESIWLLQICLAADFLLAAGDARTAEHARERIIGPASELVATYDEGMSNRQVWNNAALIASASLLGRQGDLDALAHGPSGVEFHLSRALLSDGTWYEGENYHQFAVRGLWYCVTMLEVAGISLRNDLVERLQRAFAAPFTTALPDFTMPSRKDSQYAVSLRQWRIAELTELGFARRQDPALAGALLRLYGDGVERRDTGRARSTADVERNAPPSALTRADLGWRALLHALPTLPRLRPMEARSVILESQGYAVFRRDGGIHVGFEFGQSGGGHGHPDRLNLTLMQGETRWLDDLGTGSYVDPSLHWYRSTLAHNAPLVNGKSQPVRDGTLLAYDEREGLGWILAELALPDQNARLERALVVAPDYFISELSWNAAEPIQIDLPFHADGASTASRSEEVALGDRSAAGDGWPYLREVRRAAGGLTECVRDGRMLYLIVTSVDGDVEHFQALAPGQPFDQVHAMQLYRCAARSGRILSICAWTIPFSYAFGSDHLISIETGDGERHLHRRDENGWHVELHAGGARSSIDLVGFRTAAAPAPSERRTSLPRAPMKLHYGAALVYELGEPHYRRSEVSWLDAGSPTASVAIRAEVGRLDLTVDIRAGEPIFAEPDAQNPYDNEHPDTMRAGVQLYVMMGTVVHGWTLVPESHSSRVRARALSGDASRLLEASWRRTSAGYAMRIEVARPVDELSLDLIINETVGGRERRRGQLVMSGARNEFVYLRGDRHDADRLIPMRVVP